jgi:ubiquinone/menaquinone biosynthesis C-methylase UbiE
MSLYGTAFAAMYDRLIVGRSENAGLRDMRRDLLSGARRNVLEIGAGTGLNLPHYPDGIDELVLVEPDPPMGTRLQRRLEKSGRTARIVNASAAELPFEDDHFGTVISTLVLCTVPDPESVLNEIHRVLKNDGTFLFLEHVRAADPKLAQRQDRWHRLWRLAGRGCHCNRDTARLIASARFRITELTNGEMPKAISIVRPLVIGQAVPTG